MFEELYDAIRRIREKETEGCERKLVALTTDDERDEFISMVAELGRISKELKQLQDEREIIDARAKIFWYKLKKRYKLESEKLEMSDDGSKVYEIIEAQA